MDINFPTDPIDPTAVASRVPNLLAQLRAAGTVEAEVIRLLQGQLLLSSRLGEILTRNTLDYKPGDRINLRLDESASHPVLKTSPAPRKPISLDSAQYPQLARALPPGRPMLAIVTRIAASQAEIELAGQILKLPRPTGLVKNQLLGLRRIDNRRSIEVTPLERKSVYKAVLQQLLPRRAENEAASLVKLLGLVSRTLAATRAPAGTGLSPREGSQARLGADPGRAPQSVSATVKSGARSGAAADTLRAQYAAAGATVSRSLPAARPPSPIDPGIEAAGPRSRTLPAREPEPRSQQAGADRDIVKANARRHGSNAILQPLPASKPAAIAGSHTGAAAPGYVAGIDRPAAAATTATPGDPRRQAMGLRDMPDTRLPTVERAALSAQTAALQRGATGSGALWPLLQLVTRFPEIDAARLKSWFEFAGLVRPSGSDQADARAMRAGAMLKQLADPESFATELARSLRSSNGKPTDTDAAANRQTTAESLLPQIREGVKLVEQSLAHNLMQRAALGLQQETQQPLTLSLALPLLEAQQVKTLHVELTQRNQAQQEADSGWDIRLGFDFADLGPVSCHIVVEGLAVAASFYCEREPTRERIGAALPQLRQRFCTAGFSPGEFHSFPGRAAPEPTPSAADFCESLIDIEV
ncbi:MAG: flagellar hook-length control protein FliK [Gammaproteobacteria bacterium]|nr:flagellar hook-length control protein FliK [Gammaproteobacteria bacterium]